MRCEYLWMLTSSTDHAGAAGECGGRADVDWLELPVAEDSSLVAVAVGEPLQMNVSRCALAGRA